GVGEVAADDLDARGEARRTGPAGQRTDGAPGPGEQGHQAASDVPGRSGHKDHGVLPDVGTSAPSGTAGTTVGRIADLSRPGSERGWKADRLSSRPSGRPAHPDRPGAAPGGTRRI